MSDALTLVRFEDGEIRVAYYLSDPECVAPLLFDVADADRVLAAGADRIVELVAAAVSGSALSDVEPVTIYADYGEGEWWIGAASRSAGMLIEGIDPHVALVDRSAITSGRPAWVESWSVGIDFNPVGAPLAHPAAAGDPGPAASPRRTMPPELRDDDEFRAAAQVVLDGGIDGLLFERVLEGLLMRAGDPPAGMADRLSPLLPAVREACRIDHYTVSFVANGVLELIGDPYNDDWLEFGAGLLGLDHPRKPTARWVLEHRGRELMVRLRDREPGPLLSMPTAVSGAIDPAVLEARARSLPDPHTARLDRMAADLRAGSPAVPDLPEPDWFDPRSYTTIQPWSPIYMQVIGTRELAVVGTLPLVASVFPLLWPKTPGVGVGTMLEPLIGDVNRTPTRWGPALVGGFCAWFSTDGVPSSAPAAIACGLGLGSKSELNSTPAVNLFVTRSGDAAWIGQLLPRAIKTLLDADRIKIRRVCGALRSGIGRAPGPVRDTAMALTAFLLASSVRDAVPVLTLAADAAEDAGPTDAVVQSEITALAEAPGSTKANKEARRLLAALDGV